MTALWLIFGAQEWFYLRCFVAISHLRTKIRHSCTERFWTASTKYLNGCRQKRAIYCRKFSTLTLKSATASQILRPTPGLFSMRANIQYRPALLLATTVYLLISVFCNSLLLTISLQTMLRNALTQTNITMSLRRTTCYFANTCARVAQVVPISIQRCLT